MTTQNYYVCLARARREEESERAVVEESAFQGNSKSSLVFFRPFFFLNPKNTSRERERKRKGKFPLLFYDFEK